MEVHTLLVDLGHPELSLMARAAKDSLGNTPLSIRNL
jgi:hypothetical protein